MLRKESDKLCVLSPYLFNILVEMVTRETFDGFQGGQHQDVDRRTLRGRVIQNDRVQR